jgi:hypothetical protein
MDRTSLKSFLMDDIIDNGIYNCVATSRFKVLMLMLHNVDDLNGVDSPKFSKGFV